MALGLPHDFESMAMSDRLKAKARPIRCPRGIVGNIQTYPICMSDILLENQLQEIYQMDKRNHTKKMLGMNHSQTLIGN